jgi:spore coat protein U-like protein
VKKNLSPFYGFIVGLVSTTVVWAGTGNVTTQFEVSVTIPPVCHSCVNVPNMYFGDYNPISGSPAEIVNAINVTCSAGVEYVVALDSGVNYSGGTYRHLVDPEGDGSNILQYALYMDPDYKNLWGDGTSSHGAPYYGTGKCTTEILNVYGQIPPNQIMAVGGKNYRDSITIILSY